MKKLVYQITIALAGSFMMFACSTYNSAYVDDIYYNPDKDNNIVYNKHKNTSDHKSVHIVDTLNADSSDFYYSDYNDYEYSERLTKFHYDEYEGEYYNDEPGWNTNVNIGFSPYGLSWGMGFGYGYPYYNSWYYNPWTYDPWYYSYNYYWDPWYYPYHGYHSWAYPYYYSHHYYRHHYWHSWNDHYWHHNSAYYDYSSSDRRHHYGPRNSVGSGSPITLSNNRQITNSKNAEIERQIISRQDNQGRQISESAANAMQQTLSRELGSPIRNNELNNAEQAREIIKQSNTTSNADQIREIINNSNRTGSAAEAREILERTNTGTNVSQVRDILEKNGATVNTNMPSDKSDSPFRKNVNTVNKNNTPVAVSRSAVSNKELRVPTYTRTQSAARKVSQSNESRNGYTPSYTRTRTTSNRSVYNSGSSYSSGTNTSKVTPRATQSGTSVGAKSRSYNSSSSNVVKRSSTSTQSKTRSSFSTTNKSSSSYSRPSSSNNRSSGSYSRPSSSSNRSSGSSYSSPSKSSYSSPSKSSSSGSSSKSNSSPSRGRK